MITIRRAPRQRWACFQEDARDFIRHGDHGMNKRMKEAGQSFCVQFCDSGVGGLRTDPVSCDGHNRSVRALR